MNPMQYELQVNQAGSGLEPEQFAEFRKLARELAAYQKRWGLFLLKYQHTEERRSVAEAINQLIPQHRILHVSADAHPDWPSLEQAIVQAAPGADVMQLFGLDAWLDASTAAGQTDARLRAWNVRREGFAANLALPIICWLRPATLKSLAESAPDLWAWRAAVHDFAVHKPLPGIDDVVSMQPFTEPFDNRTLAKKTLRLREIEQYLRQHQAQDEAQWRLHGALLDEMAGIHFGIGEFDRALDLYQHQILPLYEKLGQQRAVARIYGRILAILRRRGELDAALRIAQEQMLPILQKNGNLHDLAVAQANIADIMQGRGDASAALAILQQQVLPAFEALGDTRACAMALGRMGDAFAALGLLDQALQVYRDQALPRFEQLGEIRESAMTLNRIAHIAHFQGNTEEALRLYREVLPVYEKLGDVCARAAALTNIAAILQARGENDEALRLYRDEVLPVFEQIGDLPTCAKIRARIAALNG